MQKPVFEFVNHIFNNVLVVNTMWLGQHYTHVLQATLTCVEPQPSSLYPPTTLSRAIASLEKDSRTPYLASNNTSEDLPQSLRSPFLSSHHHSTPTVRSGAPVACRDSPLSRDQIRFVVRFLFGPSFTVLPIFAFHYFFSKQTNKQTKYFV